MTLLEQAAFGDRPDLDPGAPTEPRERWVAAVVLGGQGRYAAAAALLADLIIGRDPVLAALAASTLASHRRQLGGHDAARALDAEGLRRLAPNLPAASAAAPPTAKAPAAASLPAPAISSATDSVPSSPAGRAGRAAAAPATGHSTPSRAGAATASRAGSGAASSAGAEASRRAVAEAASDVLLGLAADALGVGRLGEARRLVAAATRLPSVGWRGTLRVAWVSAEIDLSAGRAAVALGHAERAVDLAADAPSVRHRIKSALVLGAALGAAGQGARARPIVAAARGDAIDLGLLSLVWPGALILAELDPTNGEEHCRCAAVALHSVLRRADPVGRLLAERSPWVPRLAGPTG